MLAYLHEVGHNHTLINEGMIVHNNSWRCRVGFLRVAASFNRLLNEAQSRGGFFSRSGFVQRPI